MPRTVIRTVFPVIQQIRILPGSREVIVEYQEIERAEDGTIIRRDPKPPLRVDGRLTIPERAAVRDAVLAILGVVDSDYS